MVHIVNAFKIFSKEDKAINVCISRFDEDTKAALRDLYSKLDDKPVVEEIETDEMPFWEHTEYWGSQGMHTYITGPDWRKMKARNLDRQHYMEIEELHDPSCI